MDAIDVICKAAGMDTINWQFMHAAKFIIDKGLMATQAMKGGIHYLGDLSFRGGGDGNPQQNFGELPTMLSKQSGSSLRDSILGAVESSANSGTQGKFEFVKHLGDLKNWALLLSGKDADLFTFDLPPLEFEMAFDFTLARIPIGPVSLDVLLRAGLSLTAHLSGGFDTFGIRKALSSGGLSDVLDGFYFQDASSHKVDKPDLSVTAYIGLGLELNLWIAKAGVAGDLVFSVNFNLNDPNHDGKIRGSELAALGAEHAVATTFKVTFRITLYVKLFALFKYVTIVTKSWTFPIAEVTFGSLISLPVPLAHTVSSPQSADCGGSTINSVVSDVLVINAGECASRRGVLAPYDVGEAFVVSGRGRTVRVQYLTWSEEFYGVNMVLAHLGAGGDRFDASGLFDIPIEVHGGPGDDCVIFGSGGGSAYGDEGDDILDGSISMEPVIIFGGPGDDWVFGGSNNDQLHGDAGSDWLKGGAGDDFLDGGPGADGCYGENGQDTYSFADDFGLDTIVDLSGKSTLHLERMTVPSQISISALTSSFHAADSFTSIDGGVNSITLGKGDDSVVVNDVMENTLSIRDVGGNDVYSIFLGQPYSSVPPGVVDIQDEAGSFDDIRLYLASQYIELGTYQTLNGREKLTYSGIERQTLLGRGAILDATSKDTFGDTVTISRTADTANNEINMGTTGLKVVANDVRFLSDIVASHFVVESRVGLFLDYNVYSNDQGYIDIRTFEEGASIVFGQAIGIHGLGRGFVRLTSSASILSGAQASISAPLGLLVLGAFDGIGNVSWPVLTKVEQLIAATSTQSTFGGDIVLIETDDLKLMFHDSCLEYEADATTVKGNCLPPYMKDMLNTPPGFAFSVAHGSCFLQLTEPNSLLTHESGYVSVLGGNITLTSDDIDFKAGPSSIKGGGVLSMQPMSKSWLTNVGTAGEERNGNEKSRLSLNLATRDLAALASGFSSTIIGRTDLPNGTAMVHGDSVYRSPVAFFSQEMKVGGEINATSSYAHFTALHLFVSHVYLYDENILRSGISSNDIHLEIGQKLEVAGWIRAYDTSSINCRGTITSFLGSEISGHIVEIDSLGSVTIGGIMVIIRQDSAISLYTDSFFRLVIGGTIRARRSDSAVTIHAMQYVQMDIGSDVLCGNEDNNMQGRNVSLSLLAHQHMRLFGSIRVSGKTNVSAGFPGVDLDDSVFFRNQAADSPVLANHTTYSLLLKGSITNVGDNMRLEISVPSDLIVIGTIDMLGILSAVDIRSQEFVYIGDRIFAGQAVFVTSSANQSTFARELQVEDGLTLYVDWRADIRTSDSESLLTVQGTGKVNIIGALTAGGFFSNTSFVPTGRAAKLIVRSGTQLRLAGPILSSGLLSIQAGTRIGATETNTQLVLIQTTSSGLTSTGSADYVGQVQVIASHGSMQLMGNILSGAIRRRILDPDNPEIVVSEFLDWVSNSSFVHILAEGQSWVGGMTVDKNGVEYEVGGRIQAADAVQVKGGQGGCNPGLVISPSSLIVTEGANSSIDIVSLSDASVSGLLLAGGSVIAVRDRNGNDLGLELGIKAHASSRISILSKGQSTLRSQILAGANITAAGHGSGGIVVISSARLETLSPQSIIRIDPGSFGKTHIYPNSFEFELPAPGWVKVAGGQWSPNIIVQLLFAVQLPSLKYEGLVELPGTWTQKNSRIEHLLANLKTAFNLTSWNVTSASASAQIPAGSKYTGFADDGYADIQVKLQHGRLVFVSPYKFELLLHRSDHVDEVGFQTSDPLVCGTAVSTPVRTVQAKSKDSKVFLGSGAGKLLLEGNVLAYSEISLSSGWGTDDSIDLTWSGVLETVNGTIGLLGQVRNIQGTIIARGENSSIVAEVCTSLVVSGRLEAQRMIHIEAVDGNCSSLQSVYINATARLITQGKHSLIRVLARDGVFLNVMVEAPHIHIASSLGRLEIAKQAGWLRSDGTVFLEAVDVVINGVIELMPSTGANLKTSLVVNASNRVVLTGNIRSDGSYVTVWSGNRLECQGAVGEVDSKLQPSSIVFASGGSIQLGRNDRNLAKFYCDQACWISAASEVSIRAVGNVDVSSASEMQTRKLTVFGDVVTLAGTLSSTTLDIKSRDLRIGSDQFSLNEKGECDLAPRGANVSASRINISTVESCTLEFLSTVAPFDDSESSIIFIHGSQNISLFGSVEAASFETVADGYLIVNATLNVRDSLTLKGAKTITVPTTEWAILGSSLVRISGGWLECGGSVDIYAGGDISMHGRISSKGPVLFNFTTAPASVLDTATVNIISEAGTVYMTGTVSSRQAVLIRAGVDVNLYKKAAVEGKGATSFWANTTLNMLSEVFIRADGPLRLNADTIFFHGLAEAKSIVLKATSLIEVTGSIRSHDSLTLQCLKQAKEGGMVHVLGQGMLSAVNDIEVDADGDVYIEAYAVQDTNHEDADLNQVVEIRSVIVGSFRLAVGVKEVEEVHWLKTISDEQVGQVYGLRGTIETQMDVKLKQLGYANENGQIKRYFVAGVDYNTTDQEWEAVTDKNDVLAQMNYRRAYDFDYTNPRFVTNLDGTRAVLDRRPSWTEDDLKFVALTEDDFAVFVRMPLNASEEFTKITQTQSEGPTDVQVALFSDIADLKLTQDKSRHVPNSYPQSDWTVEEDDIDDEAGRWSVRSSDGYAGGGKRTYQMLRDSEDNRTVEVDRTPDWKGAPASDCHTFQGLNDVCFPVDLYSRQHSLNRLSSSSVGSMIVGTKHSHKQWSKKVTYRANQYDDCEHWSDWTHGPDMYGTEWAAMEWQCKDRSCGSQHIGSCKWPKWDGVRATQELHSNQVWDTDWFSNEHAGNGDCGNNNFVIGVYCRKPLLNLGHCDSVKLRCASPLPTVRTSNNCYGTEDFSSPNSAKCKPGWVIQKVWCYGHNCKTKKVLCCQIEFDNQETQFENKNDPITEEYIDYRYHWISESVPVKDSYFLSMSFTVSGPKRSVWGLFPLYETVTQLSKQISVRRETIWQDQLQRAGVIILSPEPSFNSTRFRPVRNATGILQEKSITSHRGKITIHSGGAFTLSGNVSADCLVVLAGQAASIMQIAASGIGKPVLTTRLVHLTSEKPMLVDIDTNHNGTSPQLKLYSSSFIDLRATGSLNVLRVHSLFNISLNAGRDIRIASLNASHSASVTFGGDLEMDNNTGSWVAGIDISTIYAPYLELRGGNVLGMLFDCSEVNLHMKRGQMKFMRDLQVFNARAAGHLEVTVDGSINSGCVSTPELSLKTQGDVLLLTSVDTATAESSHGAIDFTQAGSIQFEAMAQGSVRVLCATGHLTANTVRAHSAELVALQGSVRVGTVEVDKIKGSIDIAACHVDHAPTNDQHMGGYNASIASLDADLKWLLYDLQQPLLLKQLTSREHARCIGLALNGSLPSASMNATVTMGADANWMIETAGQGIWKIVRVSDVKRGTSSNREDGACHDVEHGDGFIGQSQTFVVCFSTSLSLANVAMGSSLLLSSVYPSAYFALDRISTDTPLHIFFLGGSGLETNVDRVKLVTASSNCSIDANGNKPIVATELRANDQVDSNVSVVASFPADSMQNPGEYIVCYRAVFGSFVQTGSAFTVHAVPPSSWLGPSVVDLQTHFEIVFVGGSGLDLRATGDQIKLVRTSNTDSQPATVIRNRDLDRIGVPSDDSNYNNLRNDVQAEFPVGSVVEPGDYHVYYKCAAEDFVLISSKLLQIFSPRQPQTTSWPDAIDLCTTAIISVPNWNTPGDFTVKWWLHESSQYEDKVDQPAVLVSLQGQGARSGILGLPATRLGVNSTTVIYAQQVRSSGLLAETWKHLLYVRPTAAAANSTSAAKLFALNYPEIPEIQLVSACPAEHLAAAQKMLSHVMAIDLPIDRADTGMRQMYKVFRIVIPFAFDSSAPLPVQCSRFPSSSLFLGYGMQVSRQQEAAMPGLLRCAIWDSTASLWDSSICNTVHETAADGKAEIECECSRLSEERTTRIAVTCDFLSLFGHTVYAVLAGMFSGVVLLATVCLLYDAEMRKKLYGKVVLIMAVAVCRMLTSLFSYTVYTSDSVILHQGALVLELSKIAPVLFCWLVLLLEQSLLRAVKINSSYHYGLVFGNIALSVTVLAFSVSFCVLTGSFELQATLVMVLHYVVTVYCLLLCAALVYMGTKTARYRVFLYTGISSTHRIASSPVKLAFFVLFLFALQNFLAIIVISTPVLVSQLNLTVALVHGLDAVLLISALVLTVKVEIARRSHLLNSSFVHLLDINHIELK